MNLLSLQGKGSCRSLDLAQATYTSIIGPLSHTHPFARGIYFLCLFCCGTSAYYSSIFKTRLTFLACFHLLQMGYPHCSTSCWSFIHCHIVLYCIVYVIYTYYSYTCWALVQSEMNHWTATIKHPPLFFLFYTVFKINTVNLLRVILCHYKLNQPFKAVSPEWMKCFLSPTSGSEPGMYIK